MHSYYTLPLRLDKLLEQKQHPVCSLEESISQHLYLILTTHFEESRFNATYGCSIWEQDFEIMSNIKWKDWIRASVTETVLAHEKRLTHPKVKVEIDEFEFVSTANRRIKRRVGIGIEGLILQTNEKYSFLETIYISPMSLD
jgi:phage baseplate assembly protein W